MVLLNWTLKTPSLDGVLLLPMRFSRSVSVDERSHLCAGGWVAKQKGKGSRKDKGQSSNDGETEGRERRELIQLPLCYNCMNERMSNLPLRLPGMFLNTISEVLPTWKTTHALTM